MVLSDLLTLLFYLMQQLGMMLGFGAEIILLFTFLSGRRGGVINETDDHIAHGIYKILVIALFVIVLSGIAITATQFSSHQQNVIFLPSFIFKWLLIGIAILLAFYMRGARKWNAFLEGLSGANWSALFLIHIFAPITTLPVLAMVYGLVTLIFLFFWYTILYLRPLPEKITTYTRTSLVRNIKRTPQSFTVTKGKPSLQVPAPSVPTLAASTDTSSRKVEPETDRIISVEKRAIIASPGLPIIRVMPQTHAELEKNALEAVQTI